LIAKRFFIIFLALLLVCTAFLTTACSNVSFLTRDYWTKAVPIVNNYIEKGSRPFAEIWVEVVPAIQSGDYTAYERFFPAVMEFYPYVGEAILELTKLNPPTSETTQWQQLQLEEWSLLSEALYMYMRCWDYKSGTLIGTDEDLGAADEKMNESHVPGKEADRLQIELLKK